VHLYRIVFTEHIMSEDNDKDFPGMGVNGDVPVGPKKAVHVKWAGKTIALGTFPVAEADEKCQKAKALTRAWRSTMRPKPTREWVMLELERRNVRVVNGRVGRGDSDGEHDNLAIAKDHSQNHHPGQLGHNESLSSLLNAANVADFARTGAMQRNNSLHFRNNSLGFDPSIFLGGDQRRNSSLTMSGYINPSSNETSKIRSNSPDLVAPPHRPLVGGGSAAAYEAARADHYRKLAEQKKSQKQDGSSSSVISESSNSLEKSQKSNSKISSFFQQPSRVNSHNLPTSNSSSLNISTSESSNQHGTGGMPNLNISVNANQHYEMLKLHHMNLLNEIQETTLMMNLYQQHQLQLQQQQQQELMQQQQQQQQQKKLLEEAATGDFNSKLSLLAAQGSLMPNRESGYGQLGFSETDVKNGKDTPADSELTQTAVSISELDESTPALSHEMTSGMTESTGTSQIETTVDCTNSSTMDMKSSPTKASREDQLRKIQEEIAERQRMLKELENLDDKSEDGNVELGPVRAAKRIKKTLSEINDCEV